MEPALKAPFPYFGGKSPIASMTNLIGWTLLALWFLIIFAAWLFRDPPATRPLQIECRTSGCPHFAIVPPFGTGFCTRCRTTQERTR